MIFPDQSMDAVDVVLDCVEDMESIFMEEKFTDVEDARERIDRVIEKHKGKAIVEVHIEKGLTFDIGDHYHYKIAAPGETGAYTLAFLSPPRCYEPYESHDEDDEENDDFATFLWPSRYVTVPVVPDDVWFHVDRGAVVDVAMRPRVRDLPRRSRGRLRAGNSGTCANAARRSSKSGAASAWSGISRNHIWLENKVGPETQGHVDGQHLPRDIPPTLPRRDRRDRV